MEAPAKRCFTCGETKPVENFSWRDKNRSVRLGRCKPCMCLYHQNHYRTSEKRRIHNKRQLVKTRQRNTRYVQEYLRTHPCVDCGYDDIRALDFDHLRDKVIGISQLRFKGASLDNLQREMDKCEVRCANCHRIVTHERRGHTILDVVI